MDENPHGLSLQEMSVLINIPIFGADVKKPSSYIIPSVSEFPK